MQMSILVCLGCYNKYHSLEPKVLAYMDLGLQMAPSCCVLTCWKEREGKRQRSLPVNSLVLSDQGPVPQIPFNLVYLLKALCPEAVTLGVRASMYEFSEDIIQSIAVGHNLYKHYSLGKFTFFFFFNDTLLKLRKF